MKILYVVERINEDFGGSIINRRNLELLQRLGHEVELYMIIPEKQPLLKRLWEGILDYRIYGGLSFDIIKRIEERLKQSSFDLVFVSYSCYGALVRRLKRHFPNLRIITFFHNVELNYAYQELHTRKNILKVCGRVILTYYAERASVSYSDKLIVLNQRDADMIKKIYHRMPDVLLPTSFEDRGVVEMKQLVQTPLKYLFVGSAFYANIHGIKWFVQQVMPFVKGDLYIVGKGIAEELRDIKDQDRVHVIGAVENMKQWYMKVDIVVCPIFLGSGMKTKTAEAMMYGKPIVGTTEAFVGYDVDFEEIGGCFSDAKQAIKILSDFESRVDKLRACGAYARKEFVTKYSLESSLKIMCQVLNFN